MIRFLALGAVFVVAGCTSISRMEVGVDQDASGARGVLLLSAVESPQSPGAVFVPRLVERVYLTSAVSMVPHVSTARAVPEVVFPSSGSPSAPGTPRPVGFGATSTPAAAVALSGRSLASDPPSSPSVLSQCPVLAPSTYVGPPVAGAVPVTFFVAPRGASWWKIARRHALSYSDLSRLNVVPEATIRGGRGLAEGQLVYIVARVGLARAGALRYCDPAIAVSDVWTVFPDGGHWLFALTGKPSSDHSVLPAPALGDPFAQWLRSPSQRSFGAWASLLGLSLERLLAYNGLLFDEALASKRPRGHLAAPVL